MEVAITEILENHANDARDFPEIEQRLREHLAQTRGHAEKVRSCVESLGGSISTTKVILNDLLGRLKAVSTGMYSDELVKNALSEYMTEQFEIACYHSLIAAAEELGEARVAAVCKEIQDEERCMAGFVYDLIPKVTRQYLMAHAAA